MLNLHTQETAILSCLLLLRLDKRAWHFLTQRLTIGQSAGGRKKKHFSFVCLLLSLMCCHLFWECIHHIAIIFPFSDVCIWGVTLKRLFQCPSGSSHRAEGDMREKKSKRGQEEKKLLREEDEEEEGKKALTVK